MTRCPRCGREPDETIETGPADHPARVVYKAEPRTLLDPPERVRKDTDA